MKYMIRFTGQTFSFSGRNDALAAATKLSQQSGEAVLVSIHHRRANPMDQENFPYKLVGSDGRIKDVF